MIKTHNEQVVLLNMKWKVPAVTYWVICLPFCGVSQCVSQTCTANGLIGFIEKSFSKSVRNFFKPTIEV